MHLRWLALGSLVLGSLAAVAGCSDDAPCPSAAGFALTAPDGFAQLTPGGSVTIAWTSDGDPGATVALTATASDGVANAALPPALLGAGSLAWDGTDPTGALVPPANYRLSGSVAAVGACGGVTIAPDDLHLIVVQGVRLPAAALAFTGSQATRPVPVTTVTRAVVPLALAVDPDPTTAGDELEFAAASIPGEFTPVARSYPFTGMTTGGAAIPAGTYTLIATFGGHRTDGPQLTWQPAQ